VLQARPDVGVVRIDVSTSRCREAERRAVASGLSHRFRAIAGSAFEVDLPGLSAVVTNPPMLPAEPGFTFPAARGGRDLFWMRLLATVSEWDRSVELWLHLFDFQGVGARSGEFPTISEVAGPKGFSVGIGHRGWRAIAPSSSVRKALPALRPVFPEGRARVGRRERRFVDLEVDATKPLSIAHSIVHLARTQHHEPPSENETQEHAR
jgi:hypothetical protein